MKKLFAILLVLLFSFVLFVGVSAHSGRTDGSGGHNSEDGYHYHHGQPAHDHWDMDGDGDADCPYTFNGQNQSDNYHMDAKYKPDPVITVILILIVSGSCVFWIIKRTKNRLSEDCSTSAKICVCVNALFCIAGIIYCLCNSNHPDTWVLRDQTGNALTFSGIVGDIVVWFFVVVLVGSCIGGVEFLVLGGIHYKKIQSHRSVDVPGAGVALFSAYDFIGLQALVNILLYATGITDAFFFLFFFATA